MTDQLIIPANINYDCTGCGKCCGGWAVPMTSSDFKRVATIDWQPYAKELNQPVNVLKDSLVSESENITDTNTITLNKNSLFRNLQDYEIKDSNYRYAIKVAHDRMCPFLVDNLCLIHSKYDSTTKPAICQLFPYSFNETPTGTYVSVSFVSQAVIYNTGQALTNQYDYLLKKYADFKALFPNNAPNWTSLKLILGQSLEWSKYLEYENYILKELDNQELGFGDRLNLIAKFLYSQTGKPITDGSLKLKYLDKHLLVNLFKIYFPQGAVVRGEADFNVNRFVYQLTWGNIFPGVVFKVNNHSFKLDDLAKIQFDENDADMSSLMYRYYYCKIFGKLYFGAGFGQLSLVAGFNHLAFLYALIKINSKILAKIRGVGKVSFIDLAQSIKTIEKRLGETFVSPNTAASLELLLSSPGRLKRVLATNNI